MDHTVPSELDRRRESPPAILERVDAVLDALGHEEVLTLDQLARRLGLPGSSLHRLLQRLVRLGWVERERFGYRLGIRLRELGHRTVQLDPRYRSALPLLYELRDAVGLSVHLSVLSGDESVAMENVWGRGRVPLIGGLRHPARSTASGKVLLVGRAAREGREATLAPDLLELVPDVASVRAESLATCRDVLAEGLASVAVPVGPIEVAASALAVSGPADMVRVEDVAPFLRSTAARISAAARAASTG